MVESIARLDSVFSSLADATRRDILRRVAREELSIGAIAEHYDMSLAAVSKHLMLLEKADLIRKRRHGKQLFVQLSPKAFKEADDYLHHYKKLWEARLDALEHYLAKEDKHDKKRNK
jgi:DNA-binding transcriptional ArsR family regulator